MLGATESLLPLVILIPVLVLGGAALWIWMLVECAIKEPPQERDKLFWILVLALTGQVGALLYLFIRRPERIRKYGR